MKYLKHYFYYTNQLTIKESFSIILENDETAFKTQVPEYKILGKINVDEIENKKRKRLNNSEIMAGAVKVVEEPKNTNSLIKKNFTEEFNCKFNIYFKEEHVRQRMQERNILESDIINLIKSSIKPMVYFAFKYKFHILKNVDVNNDNNNSFMIRYLHNNTNDLQIPINVVYKSFNEYDIIVHTVINYDVLKMWDGQYVINIHDGEQPELLIKRKGSLIPVE